MTAAIACGHPIVADVAEQILAAGGNAFDAALGAMVTVPIAEPVLGSLGGGGFLLAQQEGNKPGIYDFFCDTPGRIKREDELEFAAIEVDFGPDQQIFHSGFGAVATPGIVKGLFTIHEDLGRMPISEILAPAIDIAKSGVVLNSLQAYITQAVSPIVLFSDSVRQVYEDRDAPGTVIKEGQLFKLPDYDTVLDALAHEGPRLFYEGEIAGLIEAAAQNRGGSLTREDLARYDVIRRHPLETSIADGRAWLNPPPSMGGLLIAVTLELLREHLTGLKNADPGVYLSLLLAAMDETNRARLTAHDTSTDPEDRLTLLQSEEFIAPFKALFSNRAAKIGGTTHISIIDKAGNIAALSQSNGEGCGHILPGTGIHLNNMLGEEDLNPDGFFRFAPSARIASMMCPTLVLQPDGHKTVLGSGGSNRIRTAILQVMLNMSLREMNLGDAIETPRVHQEADISHIEGGMGEEISFYLQSQGIEAKFWDDLNFFFGGVHGVSVNGAGTQKQGMGDPRRGGVHRIL